MTYRIGIIAALSGELKPLVSDWAQQADGAFLTQRGNVAAIAVAKGIGAARAEQAVSIADTYGRLDALVSIGWAGGASCGCSLERPIKWVKSSMWCPAIDM